MMKEMMNQPMVRQIVDRNRVAGGAAAALVGNIVQFLLRRGVRQRRRAEQVGIAVHAWPLGMRRTPDFDLPVGWLVVPIERSAKSDRHRGAGRCGGKFVFARPLHAYRSAGMADGDVRSVE